VSHETHSGTQQCLKWAIIGVLHGNVLGGWWWWLDDPHAQNIEGSNIAVSQSPRMCFNFHHTTKTKKAVNGWGFALPRAPSRLSGGLTPPQSPSHSAPQSSCSSEWTSNMGWNGSYHTISYRIVSYHIIDLKRQNHLTYGTNKSKLKVKMQSVSDDDVWKKTS